MKRLLSIAFAAALLAQTAIAFAQDSGEPSEQSALDVARSKYQASQDAAPASEDPAAENQGGNCYYMPLLLSFVPGISMPFGFYDTSIAGGMIGSAVRDVSGTQVSSVYNFARKVNGAQGAGVFNIAQSVTGIQGAGVFNISNGKVRGGQFAGVWNIAEGAADFQGSGVFNIASGAASAQGAGLFNLAGNIHGFQGAGLFNMAGAVEGVQAAGLVNSADSVKGVQIGLVNVARDVDGAQIGLLNFAGNGIHSLGFAYEPTTSYAYAYWQFGTPALYTVAGFGAPFSDWAFDFSGSVASLGLGSRIRLLGISIDVDISSEQAIGALPFDSLDWSGDWSAWEGWSMLRPYNSLRIVANLPIDRHWQLFGGLKADIDIDALGNRVPEALKAGSGWRGSLFGGAYTIWPKWFFGMKIH